LWSIEWGIAELVNHPAIQSKLREEITSVLGAGVAVTEPDLDRLPYLQAVVKETLRLRMAIPLLVPHMNLNDGKLHGYDIPAESKILVNAWFLANDPKRWVKPEEFRPERFLEEEKAVEAHGNDFRFVPLASAGGAAPGSSSRCPSSASRWAGWYRTSSCCRRRGRTRSTPPRSPGSSATRSPSTPPLSASRSRPRVPETRVPEQRPSNKHYVFRFFYFSFVFCTKRIRIFLFVLGVE